MGHSRHVPLAESERIVANLIGATVYGHNDEKVGTVAHVHGTGPAMQVIVDAGGFLGFGSKRVALDVNQLKFMRDESGTVHAKTSMTKGQVKELPEHHL